MLHHEPPNEPPSLQHTAPPAVGRDLSPDLRFDARVEDFLDRVFARLVAVMPYEDRRARRAAMRVRIEEAVTAHMELGSASDEAVALALAQIQREFPVTSQTVHGAVSRAALRPASSKAATVVALGFFGLFYLLDQTRVAGHLWSHFFGTLYNENGKVTGSGAVEAFYRFELLVLPIICGLATGLLAPQRPVRGVLKALVLLAIPAIAWGGVAYGLQFTGLLPSWPQWLAAAFPNPLPAVSGVAFWAALGGLSAGAGGWMRRRTPAASKSLRALARGVRRRLQWRRRSPRSSDYADVGA